MSVSQKGGELDQFLLEDIARHCPQQFLAFHQCMSKEDADPNNCSLEQYNLSGCIKKGVPSFQKIQGVCAGKLQVYEACLKLNKNDARKCTDDLQDLRKCASDSL